jgi:threonine dehydrogenase-like Zn-dependent dehydrogenase
MQQGRRLSPPGLMQALVLTASGLELQTDRPVPAPAHQEALIAVHLAGVCATDIELTRGYKGAFRGILGHEFVGTVIAAPGAEEWVDRRVVGEINVGCGDCDLCRRELGKHCRSRTCAGIIGRDGVFAEFVTLPVANLHGVPESVGDEEAVFCEPLAAAFEILEQVRIDAGTRVYVQGDGRMGLLCAWVLATTGCDLTVIGRHPEKLALLPPSEQCQSVLSSPEALAQLHRQPADIVVEVTGSPDGFATALRLVRPSGTLVLKSTFAERLHDFDISSLVVDEISIVGSRCGPFDKALAALETHAVDVRRLIDARYSLSDGLQAFAHARRKGVLKVLMNAKS